MTTQDSDHHHDHAPDHDHDQPVQPPGLRGWLGGLLHLDHQHAGQQLMADPAFAATSQGIRTVWLALGLLLLTTILQTAIYLSSGSVALLADTVHNLGDALNSIPLLFAFYLARRLPTRRYNYGFHRAEDVAGVIIVLSIAFSAAYIVYESITKLLNPQPITHLGAVAAAALIGFAGNEWVAFLQIRAGRKIGSAALVTDGLHARSDGLTSLAVLVAALGSWAGLPILDPIIGLLIGVAIVFITRNAVLAIWYRLMDAVEPEIYASAEQAVLNQTQRQAGLEEMRRLRLRWLGHRLHADVHIAVTPSLSVVEGHALAEQVRLELFEAMPLLSEALVHVEPYAADPDAYHSDTYQREAVPRSLDS